MAAAAQWSEEAPLYKDASAPVEARVRDLLGRMTLREKAGQMAQIERTVVSPRALTELGAGSVLSGGGSAPSDRASPSEWASMVDDTQRLALSSRLAIPVLYGIDAVHGHNNVVGATVFPHNVGLGASRDAELLRKIGQATALEVRATGHHWAFAPCLAVSQIQKLASGLVVMK
jgi:beta-glucosidase